MDKVVDLNDNEEDDDSNIKDWWVVVSKIY